MEDVTLSLAFIAGLLSFVSPCVLPLVPAYIGYMGGRATRNVAMEAGAKQKAIPEAVTNRASMLLHGLVFVLGFTVVFIAIGLMTTAFVSVLGSSVRVLTEIIGRVGGIVIVIFGLHFMGALRGFFNWLKKNPSTLQQFPISVLLATTLTLAAFGGLVSILALIGNYVNRLIYAVLGLGLSPVLVNIIMLIVALGIFAYFGSSGRLASIFGTVSKRSLGRIPTTILMLVLVSVAIVWAFVMPFVAFPVLALYILWLVLGGAFTDAEQFWTKAMTSIEALLYSDTRHDMEQNGRGGLSGSFIMGVVFSAGWTPCIGPLLGTILTVAAQTGDVTQAVPLLAAYSLGLGIPFILTAVLMEGAQAILRRLQRHMMTIEFASGGLLIVIGILVASGSLQSLSASLSAEQADISFRIEECGIGYVRGEMNFGQARACLNGSLHPVALGQSAAGELNTDTLKAAYLIELHESTIIDVELSRVDNVFPAIATITDDAGNQVATGDELLQIDESKYVIIKDFTLAAGRYTVTITQSSTEAATFRLKVREAEPIEENEIEIEEAATDTGIQNLDSITDLADASGAAVGLEAGNRAPDFTITTIDGAEITLSDLQGQVVLLNFWGTWCGPCRREMPEFQSLYENHPDAGFTIIALAKLEGDTFADVVQFRDDFGLTFTVAVDENEHVTDLYGVVRQPSTYIIDADGVIVYRNFGITLESQIAPIITETLQG